MSLELSLSTRRFLLHRESLETFQRVLRKHFPRWSTEIRISYDDDKQSARISIDKPGSLYTAVKEEADVVPSPLIERVRELLGDRIPYERTIAMVHLVGADGSLEVFINVDGYPLAPRLDTWYMGNRLKINFLSAELEGCTVASLARTVFEELVDVLTVDFGSVRSDEEYRAKNLVANQNGIEAVGLDISKALPGLYWLNFLGQPYCDLIGQGRLTSVPAAIVVKRSNGVIIGLGDDPSLWNTSKYREAEAAILQHLGPQFFFDKDRPKRPTVAPSLWVH